MTGLEDILAAMESNKEGTEGQRVGFPDFPEQVGAGFRRDCVQSRAGLPVRVLSAPAPGSSDRYTLRQVDTLSTILGLASVDSNKTTTIKKKIQINSDSVHTEAYFSLSFQTWKHS